MQRYDLDSGAYHALREADYGEFVEYDDVLAAIREAEMAMRERCAKIAENEPFTYPDQNITRDIADAIRQLEV